MKILAVDPGDKRIGIAISDPDGIIAYPLAMILHTARAMDVARIAELANQNDAGLILVGTAFDEEGEIGFQARKAMRLAEALRALTPIPVELWDESGSTQEARAARFQMGGNRRSRQGHMDELAATVLLQSFLEAQRNNKDKYP